jgi:hypothetical protein
MAAMVSFRVGVASTLLVAGCAMATSCATTPSAATPPATTQPVTTPLTPPSPPTPPPPPAPVAPLACPEAGANVLEARSVMIDGEPECWTLAWSKPPVPKLSSLVGELVVVRHRRGRAEESLILPAMLSTSSPRTAWIALEDFDHDGRRQELLLTTGISVYAVGRDPVGEDHLHEVAVVVGLPRGATKLSVLTDAAPPHATIGMPPPGWMKVLRATPEELGAGVDVDLSTCPISRESEAWTARLRGPRGGAGGGGGALEARLVRRRCACGEEGCFWQNLPILEDRPYAAPTYLK